MLVSPRFTLLAALCSLSRYALGVNVSIPLTSPSGAASISPSLLSFSIEQDRWLDWAGETSRNEFFFNVLDNLQQLTGSPPHIRIGADSEDHTVFNPNVNGANDIFPAISTTTPYPEATNITVGDLFFQATQFLPSNTHVTWGVNLGLNNITNAVNEAKAIAATFASSAIKKSGIVLDAIEIGNEADLYQFNGLRPSTYNSTQYVKDWIAFATSVSAAVGITPKSTTKFWGAAFAGTSHSTSGFSPQAIFNDGILSSSPGALIATISQHHYSGSFCAGSGGLLQDLMTKATIRGNLTSLTSDIAAVHAKGLDYVLGETNSYSCHGAPGVSNTAGAALWTLDYTLFASQIGISKVFFHGGIGYKYNLIQPATLTRSILDGSNLTSPLPPHVQPQYYGAIIAAEAIGKSNEAHAVELTINDSQIAGYAFFEGTKLARAVLINSDAFLTTTTGARPSTHVSLSFASGNSKNSPKTAVVKRLAIGHADDASGLTWGGQTYETSNGKVSGSLKTETVSIQEGVDIQATEVVLLTFH